MLDLISEIGSGGLGMSSFMKEGYAHASFSREDRH